MMITPDDLATFRFMARMALEVQLLPVLAVVNIVLLSTVIFFGHQKRKLIPEYGLQICFLGLFYAACFFLILVIATLGSNSANPALRQPIMPSANHALTEIFWCSLVVAIYSAWRLKTIRPFVTAFVFLCCGVLQGAFLVAGMSISGEWL
jgi:hypothetical protein